MPKYLIQGSYSPDGVKGLKKDGASRRRAVIDELVQKLGGRLECMYFGFGETDVFSIVDLPDAGTSAALSLAVAETGAVSLKTTVLLTAEELDGALKKSVGYRPPGH
jgi:uncharacterized protein with GYD domain